MDENKINELMDEELNQVNGGNGLMFHYVVKTTDYCLAMMDNGRLVDRLFDGDRVRSDLYLTQGVDRKDWNGTINKTIYVIREDNNLFGYVKVDGLQLDHTTPL